MKKLILFAFWHFGFSGCGEHSFRTTSDSRQFSPRGPLGGCDREFIELSPVAGYFLSGVRAGQTMKVEGIGDHAVSTFLEGPPGSNYSQDMAADCHSRADVDRTDAGDYKLTVQECSKADR